MAHRRSSIPVQVVADGPFAVGSVLWRDVHGELVCTVVAKATYALRQGECPVQGDPSPLQEHDGHWDDDPSRSVHVPSDLAPFKSAAEVVVVGSAFAPGDRAVTSVTARLIVANVDKAVEAWAARRFRADGSLEEAPRQSRFSLRYEHAAGGLDTDNPAGIDAGLLDGLGRCSIPRLLPPLHEAFEAGNTFPTAGFGPIAADWPSRSVRLRERDRAWQHRLAGEPMPAGFDAAFFQAAPQDQWLERALAANERIVLEALHATSPRLVTSLSGVEPHALVASGSRESLKLLGDLLVIDTDRALVMLTFRGQIRVDPDASEVRVIIAGAPMGGSVPSVRMRAMQTPGKDGDVEECEDEEEIEPDESVETTSLTAPAGLDGRSALPFRRKPTFTGAATNRPPPLVAATDAPLPPALAVRPEPMPEPLSARPSAPAVRAAEPAVSRPLAPALQAEKPPASDASRPPVQAPHASAKAASDAAARASGGAPVQVKAAAPASIARPVAAARRRAVVDMLVCDAGAAARARAVKSFAELLAETRRPRPLHSAAATRVEPDGDRADVLRILSCGRGADAAEIRGALAASLDDLHELEPPLLLVAGELHTTFDEQEILRAAAIVAQTVAGGDKKVLAAVAVAKDALAAELSPRPDTLLGLFRQIEQASAGLALPPRYVASEVDRALLEGRKYKRRTILGSPRIRADLVLARSGEVIPLYVPDSAATSLPLLPSYPVVALCEIRPREDIAEPSPDALVVVALGRVLHSRGEG